MATLYPANSSAAQAPSPAPAVNAQPIASLPADTDGWTVGNFYQAIKAAFDFIYFLAKIVGGTLSAKSMLFDGVGGAVSTPPDGTCQVTAVAGGIVTPTPAITRGALYYDQVVLAIASIHNNGVNGPQPINWGMNIASVTRTGAGTLVVVLNNGASAAAKMVPQVTPNSGIVVYEAQINSATQITIVTETVALAAVDADIFLVVFGG